MGLIILCALVIILAEWKTILFTFLFVVAIVCLSAHLDKKRAEGAVSARLIWEKPIIARRREKTGYTKTYSLDDDDIRLSNHYEYRDVVEGYKVRFCVYYGNGKSEYVTCKKGDGVYNELISKTA